MEGNQDFYSRKVAICGMKPCDVPFLTRFPEGATSLWLSTELSSV
ncbi:hypothetical protein CCACVL1_07579 [Corchorus capsularis]|uniref:Uncharacterized protein n=1 Tax=Corchorus capsularis TaxID=210143 RepID=A0A1R3J4Y1_COCAP|nr:hypothetical protein CCACVL1_07579 [Corchorus capsularis]